MRHMLCDVLQEISGLQKCMQLQKLFLYDNKISEMSELESLRNLNVLWLNSNIISEIKVSTRREETFWFAWFTEFS